MFTTAVASALIVFVTNRRRRRIAVLGGTTALLLLGVFTVVNIAVIVLRKDPVDSRPLPHRTAVALVGSAACLYLVTPLSGRDSDQYVVAGLLLALGLILSVPIYLHRRAQGEDLEITDPEDIPPHELP